MIATRESNPRRAWLAGVATLSLVFLTAPVAAQRTPSGAEVWGANCGRCHRVRAVDAYDARQWETIVAHMALAARLTPDETQAVREFLVGAARSREARSRAARSPWSRSARSADAGAPGPDGSRRPAVATAPRPAVTLGASIRPLECRCEATGAWSVKGPSVSARSSCRRDRSGNA